MKKKIISLLTSAIMIIAMMASAVSMAAPVGPDGETGPGTPTPEATYDITLHKIVMNSLEGWPKAPNPDGTYTGADGVTKYDGSAIDVSNITKFFGNGAKPLQGVYFEIYKASKDGNKIGDPIKGELTNAQGEIDFTGLAAGDYIIDEVKEKSNIAEGELSGAAAVPVKVTLPVYKADGTTFTTKADGENQLHVYPKNTTNEPPVDKFVTNEGNKNDSFDFGVPQKWIITNTVPEGIEDYKVYKFTDTIDTRLDYQQDTVKIYVGGTEVTPENIIQGSVPTTGAIDGKIYVDQPSEANGKKLTVDFKMYVKELAKLTGDKTVKIEYKTVINDKAIMGKDIPNYVDLEFGNNPNETKHKKPENPPKIYTGGKRFIKKGEGGKSLDGAEFEVLNATKDKKLYFKTANPTEYKWFSIDGTDVETGYEIKVLKSGENGTPGEFEIKGLAYGDENVVNDGTASKDYYLQEIKAPNGYALKKEPIKFTVDKTSYYTTPDEVSHEGENLGLGTLAEPLTIDNAPITIPQTGGMGTILFTVVGLALMTVAFIALRKRNNEQ